MEAFTVILNGLTAFMKIILNFAAFFVSIGQMSKPEKQ